MASVYDLELTEYYKIEIGSNWNKARESIVEVGRLLIEAKAKLSRDGWENLLENELSFTERTANRLMAISGDPRIASGTHVSQLPSSWGTLYEISRMSAEEFDDAIAQNVINPKVQRKDISSFLKEKRGEVSPTQDIDSTEYSETTKYAYIYIDYDKVDCFETLNESIQKAISAIPNVRLDCSDFEEKIFKKWNRENERERMRELRAEEDRAKKRLSTVIKEGIKRCGGRKNFENSICYSIQDLRGMPVDTALHLLDDDQHMWSRSGKTRSQVESEIARRVIQPILN